MNPGPACRAFQPSRCPRASGQFFTNQEPRTGTRKGTPARPSVPAAASPWPPGPGTKPTRPRVPKRPLVEQPVAGNSPVYSHGCKFIPSVADGAAGKPSFNASGRKTYFRYSSQGCIRARLHPGPHQPAIRRMDRGLRPGAPHRALELIWNGVVDTSGGRR